jgi:hypothetical protein
MDPKKQLGTRKETRELSPKVVGLARNQFGTRLCQRVVCSRCQKIDHVSVRIARAKDKFCRDCAEKVLATYDQGRLIAERQVSLNCGQCHNDFLVSAVMAKKKPSLLCPDCYYGFDVWRGKSAHKRKGASARPILTKVGSRTTFRKNIDDTI